MASNYGLCLDRDIAHAMIWESLWTRSTLFPSAGMASKYGLCIDRDIVPSIHDDMLIGYVIM